MHNTSEMKAILSEDFTSMQSLPVYGQIVVRELVSQFRSGLHATNPFLRRDMTKGRI